MPTGPRGGDDLHGNVPDNRATVLMLVDVINDLDFPRNEELVWKAASLARTIAMLKARCRKARVPAIYVNASRDRWRSDFRRVDGYLSCKKVQAGKIDRSIRY